MLQERILNTLEKHDHIDQRKLSRVAGLNESSISRYLNGFEDINFESLLRIVQFLYPEQEIEIMSEQIMNFKSKNARLALEYCDMNHLTDHFDHLLKLLSASTNPVDKEWAAMYELIRLQKKKQQKPVDLLGEVEVFRPKEKEMQVLKNILKGYIYFDMNEHHTLSLHMNGTDALIDEIKSTFIKEAFKVRLGLIMSYVSLYRNKIDDARHYVSLVLDQDFFEQVKATAYHQLGHSYLFESYDESIKNLELALNRFKKANIETHVNTTSFTIEFVKSFWGIERDFPLELDSYKHIVNYAYYLIQKGEKKEAQEVMNQIDLHSLPDWEKGFYYYYLGLIHDDKDYFYDSVEWFKRMSDFFHLMLPIKELDRLKENKRLLNLLLL